MHEPGKDAGANTRRNLAPSDLAEVQIPVATICDPESCAFDSVVDLFQFDRGRQYIDQDFPAGGRYDPGSRFWAPAEFVGGRVHGKHIARDPHQSIGVGIHDSDEVAVGFLFDVATVYQVNFFAGRKDDLLHVGSC